MANPTHKSPEIDQFLNELASRRVSILHDICVPPPFGCGGPAVDFRDKLSEKEYRISGLCQKCQDEFFGVEEV